MDEIKYFCSKDCPDSCEFYASLKKDNTISIKAVKETFLKKGFVCKKLKKFYEREILCNNAQSYYIKNSVKNYDFVIDKLADFLALNKDKKILFYRGSGSLGYYMGYRDKFFSNFDNCYFINGSPCDETGISAHNDDFGICTNPDIENLEKVKTILLFGKNAFVTSPHLFVYLQNLKKQGKKIIYIDPIKTETAAIADRYIKINPASDGLLSYALLDKMGYVSKIYDFDKTIKEIGIKTQDFEYILDSIKTNETAFIEGLGMQRYSNGKNSVQWVNRLAYYTDNIDNLFYSRSSKEGLKPIKKNKKHRINIADLPDYLKKNYFDIIFIVAANPIITMPENKVWKNALKNSKTVLVDTNVTKTGRYADFFIKVGGIFAQNDIQGSYFFNKTLTRKRLAEEKTSDTEIIKHLSKKLSFSFDMEDFNTIKQNNIKPKRVFKNKAIPLLFPYSEKEKVRLITLSNADYLNSQNPLINKDVIFISRELAEKYDLKDNQDIVLENNNLRAEFICRISNLTNGNTAFAYKNRSKYINLLTRNKTTDACNGIAYYDLFVKIK